MNLRNLLRFLFAGNADAIRAIAADRRSPWAALLFVLAAGFAREYDVRYLQAEWPHLLLPLGASLAISLVLFALLRSCMSVSPEYPGAVRAWWSFLGLFWSTAPIALLYAIPYERFLSDEAATSANLWTLAVVSGWRVLLMIRVARVLFGAPLVHAIGLVMTLADAALLGAFYFIPGPVFDVMSGTPQTPSDRQIAAIRMLAALVGVMSSILWVPGALAALAGRSMRWSGLETAHPTRLRWMVLAGALAMVMWIPFLPHTQREQKLRYAVVRRFAAKDVAGAVGVLSSHERSEFPPQWEPPPRLGWDETEPDPLDVMEYLLDHPAPPWVREVYVEKFSGYYHPGYFQWNHDVPGMKAKAGRVWRLLERLPEAPALQQRERRCISADDIREVFGTAASRAATAATDSP